MPYTALANSYWVSFQDVYQCQGHAYRILLYTDYHNTDTLKITTEQRVYVQKLSCILDSHYNYVITYA